MPDEQSGAPAPDPCEVVVTVTTIRYTPDGEMGAVREATARGTFDDAILDALQQRLYPWALAQVFGKVLARRPPAGKPIEYEGWFIATRQVLVSVCPACEPGSLPVGKPRLLKGLFLPTPDSVRELVGAASVLTVP